MQFSIQPRLGNKEVMLVPLQAGDFDALYEAAADPAVWAQHPNKDRWQKSVFQLFFEGALKSGGAFKLVDKTTQQVIGSTRFYDYDEADDSILIGYTFYRTSCWGRGINQSVKALMRDYIFQHVGRVYFHIGAGNVRSQIAIGRLGAIKVAEQEVAYYGEPSKLNFVYSIEKEAWLSRPGLGSD